MDTDLFTAIKTRNKNDDMTTMEEKTKTKTNIFNIHIQRHINYVL